MKKGLRLLVVFLAAGLGLWLFPALSVVLSAPNELTVLTSDGVSQVTAGDGITRNYVITVTNTGIEAVNNVNLSDTWPAGFVRGVVTTNRGSCEFLTNPTDFTCSLGRMTANQSATVTASYTVPAGTPAGTYTNIVLVGGNDGLQFTANDATTVVTTADLGLAKSDGVDLVAAGNGVTYTYVMTVTNNGPSLAGNVVLTDTWPSGFERVSAGASQGGCDLSGPADFTCALGGMAVGASATITASYTVPAGTAAGIYTNTVYARADDSTVASTFDENTVVTTSDLRLVKSDGVSQVAAGNGVTYTYTMTVTNNGPSLAGNVILTDTWPVGFERGSVTTSQGACTLDDPANFTCGLGDLAVGASATVTANYTVLIGTLVGSYTNQVQADSDSSTQVTASDINDVVINADLDLVKSDGVDLVAAGNGITYTYTVSVTNNGPSLAGNVILTDTWPSGFERLSVGTSQGDCDLADPADFTCALGGMAVGASATITASYTVPAGTPAGIQTNTVRADSEVSTPAEVSDVNDVVVLAEFGLVKTDGVDQVTAGEGITYTYVMTVTNNGPSIAGSVVLTDTWPLDFERGSVGTSHGICTLNDPVDFTCALGEMAVGASATITASYTVPAVTPAGIYTNTMEVDSDASTPVSISDVNSVVAISSLQLEKNDRVSEVTAGDGITYTYVMTVTNNGPSLAGSVVLTDTWPVGFQRESVTNIHGTCTLDDPADFTCGLGDLGVGASAMITTSYTVPAFVPAGIYTNTMEVDSDASTPVSISDENSVVATASLHLEKSDGVSEVTAGEGITYTYVMTVTNDGPSLAGSVVLTDTWPVGFERGTVGTSHGICTLDDLADFTCELGDLDVSETAVVTATYTVPASTPAGIQTNTVGADSAVSTPVQVSDVNTVVLRAGLSVVKDDGVSQVIAGDGITYTYVMTVTNNGPSPASNVVLTDTWPLGFERGSVGTNQGDCTLDDPADFTCALGGLDIGSSVTITASYTVPAVTPAGIQTNTVQADSEEGSPVSDTDANTVVLNANLGLTIQDSPDPAATGGTIQYTLQVTNAGPATAVGVVLTDTLPAGLTFISAGSSPGCAAAAGLVSCNVGELASGGSRQVLVRAQVSVSTAGTIINHANVASDILDPDESNNQAQASTLVADTILPQVSWVLPVEAEDIYFVVCQNVHLEATASDNIGIQRVRFYRWVVTGPDPDDGYYTDIGNDMNAPYWQSFNTCALPLGYTQLFVESYDTWTNKSTRERILLYKTSNDVLAFEIYLPMMAR